MQIPTRGKILAAAILVAVSTAAPAGASNFPSKPIRWIVPFPPGGSNDVLARFVGIKLSDRLGEQVIIDNRGGANGIIGAEIAAHQNPDGYTLLMVSTSYVMNAAVRTLPYDVVKSFDPIATIASSPNSIVVSANSRFGSVRDLVAQAKSKPRSINYASTGVGGFNHFGGELFKKVAGVDLVHVPYKGGGPAMTDVMGGQIPVMFSSLTQVLPNVRAGRLKLLAVGAQERSPAVPDVPTVAEAGFPGYDVTVWWGVVAPRGVPQEPLGRLHDAFSAVLADPQTQAHLMRDAAEPLRMSPQAMHEMIRADVRKWTDVAREANIRVPGARTASR